MHRRHILLSLAIGIVGGFLFSTQTLVFASISMVIITAVLCYKTPNSGDDLFGLPSTRIMAFFQYGLGELIPFLIGMWLVDLLIRFGIFSSIPDQLLNAIFR